MPTASLSPVAATGTYATSGLTSPTFLSSSVHLPSSRLSAALQRLSNVRVDTLPVIRENRPAAFVLDESTRTPSRRRHRMRLTRSIPKDEGRRQPLIEDTARSNEAHVDDGVFREPMPTFSVTASLSLRSLEDALKRCASPVSALVRDGQAFYAAATDRSLSENARRYLAISGQFIDSVSSLVPTLGRVHGVCAVGARLLEIQRGVPVSANDVTDVSMMMRDVTHTRLLGNAHPNADTVGVPYSGLPTEVPLGGKPLVNKDTYGDTDGDAVGNSDEESGDRPGPVETFELNFSEAGEAEVEAGGEGDRRGEGNKPRDAATRAMAGAGAAAGASAGDVDGKADPWDVERVGDVEPLGNVSPIGQVEAIGNINRMGEVDLISEMGARAPLPTDDVVTRYPCALIVAVPIMYVPAEGRLAARWRRMPLEYYAAQVPIPADIRNGQKFVKFGIEFIRLDGHAYPLYAAHPDSEFLYSLTHPRLPPLPMIKSGPLRFRREAPLVPVKGIPVFPGNDGFIRINNKRYVVLGEIIIEADRPQLIGEVQCEQHAMVIDSLLSGPDVDGLIHSPAGITVIEGGNGYYRVAESGISGEVDMLDARGERVGIRLKYDSAYRRWSISSDLRDAPMIRQGSRDSLNTYQTKLEWSAFLRRRPALRDVLGSTLKQLEELNLYRPNRLSPRSAGSEWITNIYEVRRSIQSALRDKSGWEQMSVRGKQLAASRLTWRFFRANQVWGVAPGAQAFCSEMLDIALATLSDGIDARHLLQIVFQESPGTGRNHVAMLYADDPAVFGRFGDIDTSSDHATLPFLEHEAFADWLLEHRENVALIDPWGPEKLNDFSQVKDRAEVAFRLKFNLREAKFNMDEPMRYRVGALVPSREKRADQRAEAIASKDIGSDANAPCLLLNGCL